MAEALKTTWAGGEVLIPKTQLEAEARDAYHAGRSATEACPYPFHTDAGLHWLATFYLCNPLPACRQPLSDDQHPHP